MWGFPCDGTAACLDAPDERNCHDQRGHDVFVSGEQISSPEGFCWRERDCGFRADPPVALPQRIVKTLTFAANARQVPESGSKG